MNDANIFSEEIKNLFYQHSGQLKDTLEKLSSKNTIIEDTRKVVDEIYKKCKINFDVVVDFNNPTHSIRMENDSSSMNISTGYQQYAIIDNEFSVKGEIKLNVYPYRHLNFAVCS